jgi:hypothetical protein
MDVAVHSDPRALDESSGVEGLLEELDAVLIGLASVKGRIHDIAALLLIDKLRREQGLPSQPPLLHMCFTGNPGTGQTTVALHMAGVLKQLFCVRKGHWLAVTRDDLVVILAGGKDRMDTLLRSNPGMASRVAAHHIDFPDDSEAELVQIAQLMLKALNFRCDADALPAFEQNLNLRQAQLHFANPRSVRASARHFGQPHVRHPRERGKQIMSTL